MSKESSEFPQLQESAANCLAQNKYGEAIAAAQNSNNLRNCTKLFLYDPAKVG
jgi:hypothetical protein